MSTCRKRKYEDEYRLISDLTGFDNLRAMIEAEKSRKKRKKKKKNNPLHTSSQPVYPLSLSLFYIMSWV
jgi:hypothetical protein